MSQNYNRPAVDRAAEARAAGSGSNLCANHTTICAAGKPVGHVRGEVFYKTIITSHILHTPPALAFDVRSLEDARAAGAVRVDVFDKQTGCHYLATINQILERGFRFNRGFGDQIGLHLSAWVRLTKGAGRQLDLLGGGL